MPTIVDRLTFAWWNTGLSPVGRDRASQDDRQTASQIVAKLLDDFQTDFLGLAEVTEDDISFLASAHPRERYALYDGTLREGKAQFDTGAIYDTSKLRHLSDITSTIRHGNRQLKLLNRIDFLTPGDEQPFHVFLSHWPSPMAPESESARITHGAQLRSSVDQLIRFYRGDGRVVIMGDFNEEPFQESLAGQLLATRDRRLASQEQSYFYNPFWRHLGESSPYLYDGTQPSFAGTCYIRAGHLTKWKTVDQIMVSSIFLGRGKWHLNETLTRVLHLTPKGLNPKKTTGIFDHFPVITVLERYSEGRGDSDGRLWEGS